MGGAIAERYPTAADLFTRAERVLGYDVRQIVRTGPDEKLRETQFSQPAIYVVNYALALAAGDALSVVATAGHSFAEFCSLTLAGALTFEEALGLVRERGLAMQEAAERAPGAMAAVLGLDVDNVRMALAQARAAGRVQIANFNAADLAARAGAKRVVPLNVSGAWHSELMAPASERFAPFVERATIREPQFAVISNVDARPYRSVTTIRTNLVRSVTGEVLWHAAAERLVAEGLDLVVEFGGSAVLAPLFKRLSGAPKALHAGDEKGVEKLRAQLGSPATA